MKIHTDKTMTQTDDHHIRLAPELSTMLANVANRHNLTPDELIGMAIRTMNAALPAQHRFKTKTRPKQDHDTVHDHK